MADLRSKVSRRRFGKSVAQAGAAAAAPMLVSGPLSGQTAATTAAQAPSPPAGGAGAQPAPGPVVVAKYGLLDKIRFGGIGIRNRGIVDLGQLLTNDEVEFVAVADIRESARETIKSYVDGYYKRDACQMYRDPEQLLARKDIDAVLIATSDRWHGPMGIWAAQAGKDIYSEKPAAMSILESYALADNVRRYGVVYQSGCQRKNQFTYEYAAGLARSGKLGRLLAVHADTQIGLGMVDQGGHGWWPEEKPEPDPLVLDWDKWLGPCLWRPYNSRYPDGGRTQFWDFHAALLEWGSHTIAAAQWAADTEHTEPIEYVPEGGVFRGDGLTGPYTVTCRYVNGVQLIVRNHGWVVGGRGACSNRFEGTEGWVEVDSGGRIEMSPNLKSLLPTRQGIRYDPTAEHIREFLHSIRSRIQPRANAEVTAHAHVACHAVWIAGQLNRKLTWDPAKRTFIGDEEANRMRSRAYREPWRLEALATSM
ncbi:MAG: Gfo/Idh/MocA family oxidoreductase [Bryobacterales bacterium]|nr:Gfo/Idh/MocA family oxidoreductase [Bryobacterales bacterium]